MPVEVFAQYPVMTWTAKGAAPLAFPCDSVAEDWVSRIVEHERPYRKGAKLDDTNEKARRWKLNCTFDNSIGEVGLDASIAIYPDLLNRLLKSFDVHETGNLVLSTRGAVRARAGTYSRVESQDFRDGAKLELTFIEDNEDAVDQRALKDPQVRATARRLAEQTQFSAEASGAWDDDFSDLIEFASELEGLMAAPGRALDDLEAQVRRNRRAVERAVNAGEKLGKEVDGVLADPQGATTTRLMRTFSDREAQAADEKTSSLPRLIPYVVPADTDLYSLAAKLGQDAAKLLEVNAARIDDPLFLAAGDVIRIFAS